jgi:hypothetical protein
MGSINRRIKVHAFPEYKHETVFEKYLKTTRRLGSSGRATA